MFTGIIVFFTVFLKNRNFISKIRRSNLTDYAALTTQTRARRSVLSFSGPQGSNEQTRKHDTQDINNTNDPQKKNRLGTVSKKILLEGLNRFHGTPT